MHLKSAVALALTLVSAEAVHQGFNYGAAKVDGSSKVQSDFEAEFKTAKNLVGTSGFTSARLYTMIQGGTANDPISAIPAAIAEETSLLLGLWASGGGMDNEIAALKKAIDQYGDAFTKLVVGISVGSEDLYRNSVDGVKAHAGIGINPDELVSYIEQVRSTISGTSLSDATIGHVDTWTAWVNGTNSAVIEACDWLGFDGYPYFQNTMANGIEDAKALFDEAVGKTKAAAGGKEVWITETGWPVSGKTENLAVANTENAKIYWDEVGCPLFGDVNTWWYILEDAGASPSFGVVGSDLSTTPLYDLSCKGGSSSSSSSASASSSSASPIASAGASSGASTGSGSAGVAADSSSGQSAGSTEGSSGASSGQFAGSSAGSAGSSSGSEGQSTGSSTGSGSEHAAGSTGAGSTGAGSTGAGSTGADSTGAGSSSGSGEQAAGSGADSTGAGSSSGSTGSSAGSSTGSGSSSGSGEQAAGSGADSTGAGSSGSADQSTGSSAGSSTGSTGSSTGSSGASSGSSSGASSGSSGSSGSGSGSAAGTSRVSSAIIPGGQSTPHPGRPNIPSGGGASRVPTFASSRASSIVVPSPTKAAVSSHPTSTGSKSEGSGSGSGSGTGAGKSEGSASSSASVPLATSGATQLTGSVFSIVVLMFAVVVAV